MKNRGAIILFIVLFAGVLSCNLPSGGQQMELVPTATIGGSIDLPGETGTLSFTPTITIIHTKSPSASPPAGKMVYDVESSGTALEKRAPYGDSYKINRLERPFLQDMTYIPDLDIVTYTVSQDADWFYISIELIGNDPNNSLGLNFGAELDIDHDGFGDFIIWARPPYTGEWNTLNVQIYEDKNQNTGGISAEKSDAPFTADGYESLIFNGGSADADPDMAWVRINAGEQATVQVAFKKSWSGTVFMLGVIADAGLKDVGKLDYVDRFTEQEAGSPIKDKQYYPLKALYAVDNACREAFGFNATGYEPQLCPRADVQPTRRPGETAPPPPVDVECPDHPDPGNCEWGWSGEPFCMCVPG